MFLCDRTKWKFTVLFFWEFESDSASSVPQISFWTASIIQPFNHASFEIRMFVTSFLRLYKSLRTHKKSRSWPLLTTAGLTLTWVFQKICRIMNQTYLSSTITGQAGRQFLLCMISSSALLTTLNRPKYFNIFRPLTLKLPHTEGSFLIASSES